MRTINAAIDIETTGLDPKIHDIIDLAVVPLDDGMRPLEDIPEFSARMRASCPDRADPAALRINGLDPMSGEDEDQTVVDFRMWAYDNRIGLIRPIGHNVDFSMGFLLTKYAELKGLFDTAGASDTLKIARGINDSAMAASGEKVFASISLSALRRFFGLPGIQTHHALDDARDIVSVYHGLVRRFGAAM